MCCDHSICESTSLCDVKLLDTLEWNTFFNLFYLCKAKHLEHTTTSYYKTRLIQLDVFSVCELTYMHSQPGMH